MAKKNDIEKISLDIANYWASNDFLTEVNERCGTLIAFDWADGYLTEINTNIDLSDLELYRYRYVDDFKFDIFVEFLKENNFSFVLGLRNIIYEDNPSKSWTDKLKKTLKSNEIDYDEYIIDQWPCLIPKFDVPDNVFILRYSYDEHSKIDQLAAHSSLFKRFIKKSDWEKYYKDEVFVEKERVIVFCSELENLVLKEGFNK